MLLLFLDLPLLFPLCSVVFSRYQTLLEYPMAVVIAPAYDVFFTGICIAGHLVVIPACILAYFSKNRLESNTRFAFAIVAMILMLFMAFNEWHFANLAKKNFNPEIVQSTMIEIDLQQLEELQSNGETTMIYFGRPSCAHCSEIKPNLDILVNNSHSKVYYYNTEQDRDDNHDEMQTVLDTYGVEAVPALVVWADAGETQEIYFNEDVVDYFLDTSRFSY